jgi:glucan 1,3-beta-glucosidase
MTKHHHHDHGSSNEDQKKHWIRGVNVGGWLLAERFITPYLFAVNSCHLEGNMCWYPGQIGMPDETMNATNICTPDLCTPIRLLQVMDGNADYHPRNAQPYKDYPVDEYTLGQAFENRTLARLYMERHWETFVTFQDLVNLKNAGVTHLRVPLSYWIRGNVVAGEPYIPGGWKYFVRFAKWCREIDGLTIWADLHGAPGSQNGFDNSGHYLGGSSCKGWCDSAENVERTVDIVTDIATAIKEEGLHDVVKGFGLLNEPFLDCDEKVLRNYYTQGLDIVRTILGNDTAVFIGDMFGAWRFNNGWWTDEDTHQNTYLDSHPYHVFFEKGRAFTPRQHVAYVCRHNHEETVSCCYDDAPNNNTIPSTGISRIMGEWSAAYDSLPTAMAPFIMKTIAATGVAPHMNRTVSVERQAFMRNFVEAQMVTYEAKTDGVSSGWLFWNFKMEYV